MAATNIPFRSPETYYIAPNNSDSFTPPFSALFVSGAGNIVVRHLKQNGAVKDVATTTFSGIAAGQTISGLVVVGVNATSTTATGIIGVV